MSLPPRLFAAAIAAALLLAVPAMAQSTISTGFADADGFITGDLGRVDKSWVIE